MRGFLVHDKELASRRVRMHGSCHGEDAGIVRQIVFKSVLGEFAFDRVSRAAHAVSVRASALDHEAADHTVEDQAVIEAFINQGDKVPDRIRGDFRVQFRFHDIAVFHFKCYNWICHNIRLLYIDCKFLVPSAGTDPADAVLILNDLPVSVNLPACALCRYLCAAPLLCGISVGSDRIMVEMYTFKSFFWSFVTLPDPLLRIILTSDSTKTIFLRRLYKMASLSLEGIQKIYPNGFHAVKDFNLEIEDKEFIIFVGPSGCGKSTTLRMVAGLEDISGGTLKIDGKVMNDVEPKDRDIAMVFQNYALYPHMTVYDNMAFGLKLRKVPKDEIDKKVREAARILDLEKLLDRKPKALSGGQRQRVAMGRAIVRNPKVFLMDEPLSNLDAKLRVQMRIEISKLHENLGATIIYVTHDQTEAMTLGTRIVVMKDGVVQQVDTPQNLYNTPCNLFVAGFIGSPQMNFMDAVCKVNGQDVTLTVGDHVLKVPASKKKALIDGGYDGKTVVLGIRPEDVHDSEAFISNSPDSVITSTIKVYELLGAEVFLYFDVEGTQMTARVNPRTTLRTGDKAVFALDMEKIHVFDKETELTITN